MSGDVVVHPDQDTLAATVAARLLVTLVDAQAARGEASVVLTGGGVAGAVYREMASSPARHAVDWTRVTVWWGDERFLPTGDPERNETQARQALGLLLAQAQVHPMPATDGPDGDDADAAAERYAGLLTASGAPPRFDVLLLGVGEDGHVASLFPGQPALHDARAACAVYDAPKPPPTRVTLTLPTIRGADRVWLVAAGGGKASAVAAARGGTQPLPAGAVGGQRQTAWLLDRAAATELPVPTPASSVGTGTRP